MPELRWGPWRLDEDRIVLDLLRYGREEGQYEVDLERCNTSAEALDWIAQVARKTWATPEIVGNLVFAMDELLDLQGSLCGMGQDRKLSDAAKQVKRAAAHIKNAHENAPLNVVSASELAERAPTPDSFRAEYD